MLSDIVHVKQENDKKLFDIDTYRHSKRIKRDELLNTLQKYGYDDFTSKHSYIQFTKKSPIDTTFIQQKVKNLYKKKYREIKISSVKIIPTHYLEQLPKRYTVVFNQRAQLSNKGVVYIKTDDNKKIFFNYHLNAVIVVLTARVNIQKDSELQSINTRKKSIILHKFRAMPLQSLHVGKYQAKHNIKANTVLTNRDVIRLYVIKRGTNISVTLKSEGINIFFSAKALQNGRVGDIISVKQRNGKVLKARVLGKNKAEIQ